jgi:gluconolactonase
MQAMSHVSLRPEFEELIEPDAPAIQLATDCTFTEGPVWHPVGHFLLFSDMPGDVRRRWDPHGGVTEVKRPANKCNGMTYDADLNLIVCEHATSLLVREKPDGAREVLASHFEGKELNSPNDVCVRSDGSIYFTDPYYGRVPVFGVERPRELGFQGVYRVRPGGAAPQLVVDRDLFEQPNGLCFSPDEQRLYVNDSAEKLIRAFSVAPDGSLSGERLFASEIGSSTQNGGPDGMKCDERGNVWVTGPGGVWVYARSGELIGKLRIPEVVANLAWGGPEFRTLFLTATHSVYRVTTKVGPRIEPYMKAHAAAKESPAAGSRPAARRADYSGHAERRGERGRRLRRVRRAFSCESAERGREYSPSRCGGARPWRSGYPCLVRRRAGGARRHAQRAAVQGSRGAQGGRARDLGRCASRGA